MDFKILKAHYAYHNMHYTPTLVRLLGLGLANGINPLTPRRMRRNQSRGYTNANEKWRFLCCIDSLALYLVK